MTLYHIEKSKYQKVWPPEGTLHAEGRWNKPGQWLIYTSPTVSLAKLEVLANDALIPIKRVCLTIEVLIKNKDDDIFLVDSTDLPENWFKKPYPQNLGNWTAIFLASKKLLMSVPSAQSHREVNYLINVRHPDFWERVKLADASPEPFDSRLK